MENVSDESCRENQIPHFMFNNGFFFNCAICEIMWKNTVEPGMPKLTMWHMHAGYLSLQTHSQNT